MKRKGQSNTGSGGQKEEKQPLDSSIEGQGSASTLASRGTQGSGKGSRNKVGGFGMAGSRNRKLSKNGKK